METKRDHTSHQLGRGGARGVRWRVERIVTTEGEASGGEWRVKRKEHGSRFARGLRQDKLDRMDGIRSRILEL